MVLQATTLSREAQAVRLNLLETARRWEDVRPVIGRVLNRRRTRVSDLRANWQVHAAERVILSAADLPSTTRRRDRVRFRTRGQ